MKLNNEIRDYIRNHVGEKCEAVKKPLDEERDRIQRELNRNRNEICEALNAVLDSVKPKLAAVCRKYGIEPVSANRFECDCYYTTFTTKRIEEINRKLREQDAARIRLTEELFVRASLGCDYDALQKLLANVKF